jgi:hypothetical protein
MIANTKNIMANNNESQWETRKRSRKLREKAIKFEKSEISISFELDAPKQTSLRVLRKMIAGTFGSVASRFEKIKGESWVLGLE